MEHLSQLEQKASSSVSRREHKGPRDDKVTKEREPGQLQHEGQELEDGVAWDVSDRDDELRGFKLRGF